MRFLDRLVQKGHALQHKEATVTPDWQSDRGWTLVTGSAGELPTSFEQLVKDGFRRNAACAMAVRAVVQAVAEAPIYAYTPDGDDWKRLTGHPAETLFVQPNRGEPGLALIERSVQHYLVGGNTLLEKERARNGQVVGVHAIRPDLIVSARAAELLGGKGGIVPVSYRVSSSQSGAQRDIDADDAILIPDIDPLNEIFGMPRLLAAVLNIRSDKSADEYVAEMLANHGSPGLVVGIAAEAKPDTIERAQERWEDQYGPGRGRGKIAFAPGATVVKEIGFSLKDLEFPELRRISGERICGVIGVDPMLVGLGSAARGGTMSGAEYEAANRRLWKATIIPMIRRFEAYLNAFLAPEFGSGVFLFFELEEVAALQEDRTAAVTRAVGMAGAGVYQPDEIRAETGHDPLKPADLVVRSFSTTVVPVQSGPDMIRPPAAPAPGGGENDEEDDEEEEAAKALKTERLVAFVGGAGMATEAKVAAWHLFSAFAKSREPVYEREAQALLVAMREDLVAAARSALRDAPEPVVHAGADAPPRLMELPYTGQPFTVKGITPESAADWQKRMGVQRSRYHKEWLRRFRDLTRDTTTIVGGAVTADLGASFDIAAPEVQRFLEQRANLVAGASDETFNAIRSTIAEGMKDGDSTAQLAARVQAVFDEGYSRNGIQILSAAQRAHVIARTEATAAANGGALAAARSTGLELEKEWINQGDARVRDQHQDAPVGVGGERVKADEAFSNGLQHPGDADADDPAEVVNCRCSMLLYPVAGGTAR